MMYSYMFVVLLILSCLAATNSLNQLFRVPALNRLSGQPDKKEIRRSALKDEIKALSKGTSNGISASPATAAQIASLSTQLETLNPTRQISNNKLLSGNWKLVYTTNDGSSAGKLGPFVGRVDQLITVEERKYINYVRLGGGALVEGALEATWKDLGPAKWQVEFKDISIKLFNSWTVLQKSLEGSVGIWRMTYLDDDFRILYAQGGKNTVKENVYILVKED
jgi:PAP_fibrillin